MYRVYPRGPLLIIIRIKWSNRNVKSRTFAQDQNSIRITLYSTISLIFIAQCPEMTSSYRMIPIIRGTQAPNGIFFRAAPQNSPSKNPKIRRKPIEATTGQCFTYCIWIAIRIVVENITVATENPNAFVRDTEFLNVATTMIVKIITDFRVMNSIPS